MQEKKWDQEIQELLAQLNIDLEGVEMPSLTKDEEKKIKKRFKKSTIDAAESSETALNKTNKLVDELIKAYEVLNKQYSKVSQLRATTQTSRAQTDKAAAQMKMTESLHKGFQKKYHDILQGAKDIQKEEEQKRKKLIEELQERIRVVQEEYESAGKTKIEKYRENQTLKHELNRLQPQTATTESLYEAQMKKKQIEVEIQMTTLKQKIEMMNNFKNVSAQTKEKIEKGEEQKQKIGEKLAVLNGKQEEHKMVLTKAHLVMEDYKNAIKKINVELGKKENQALEWREKVKKAQAGLTDMEKQIKQQQVRQAQEKDRIKMLLTLEQNLKKQLI